MTVSGEGSPVQSNYLLDLVVRAACGDRVAFGELYTELTPMVESIVRRTAPLQAADVEDVSSAVWCEALERISGFAESPKAFRGWLALIARGRVQDFLKSSKRAELPFSFESDELFSPPSVPSPEEELLSSERVSVARSGLRRLAPRQRLAVISKAQDRSCEAVAADLGISQGAVKALRNRGYSVMRSVERSYELGVA